LFGFNKIWFFSPSRAGEAQLHVSLYNMDPKIDFGLQAEVNQNITYQD
jgi:hypothetical protein